MTQSDMILKALKQGDRITSLDALTRFRCMRLASRISDLKKQGVDIRKKMITTDSQKNIAQYYIALTQVELF